MVSDLVRRLFHGDVTQMVHQLLDADNLSEEELTRLEALIRERKRR
jgi:hypothetical protein